MNNQPSEEAMSVARMIHSLAKLENLTHAGHAIDDWLDKTYRFSSGTSAASELDRLINAVGNAELTGGSFNAAKSELVAFVIKHRKTVLAAEPMICKTCGQTVPAFEPHNCPGLQPKSTQAPDVVREALKPFADCADQIEEHESDEEWAKFRLLIKDYRRAKAALSTLPTADAGPVAWMYSHWGHRAGFPPNSVQFQRAELPLGEGWTETPLYSTPTPPAGDEGLVDFIAEARIHAGDMPPVIQRDYLNAALDKLEALTRSEGSSK